ncbi:4-(cytidine 5'-diphospho)-2-C-methyl-D-erythritol kinase [Parafilimonas terrae]|uniref:4-diphosphocytidyl-2-C-methyl-D-erythritol kinase n=1 Tax=Parafilimonas terrae TaxID=1465490 RepID=A0A1I5USU7_9BACT|nr:4-(cytidine 5'-diphospho)-2-C-methyl-D-erythritol kinase [Parafilimonas terrae]SFP98345.1 4-diphosphocytidyl-2-C-methyl-D-erythritol kinase [Parafilimonas terrae]
MIVFPNCKINIGLSIIGKRSDGYHNLETVFYPLPFYDVLEVIHHSGQHEDYTLTTSGIEIEGAAENNLCVKAYRLLKHDFPQLPSVKIHLHKAIPSGAGLGGGSADGAFMLMLLNDKFKLHLTEEKLLQYALMLGSDCPFFIINKPSFAQQRGEVMQPVQLDLSGYHLMLINPLIHVNTGWAFSQVDYSGSNNIKSIIEQPVETWQGKLENAFEQPVFEKYPEIKIIKNVLLKNGALFASMSGSGSSVYGIFSNPADIDLNVFPSHYFVQQLAL